MPAGAPEFHGSSRVNVCSTPDERLAHLFEPAQGGFRQNPVAFTIVPSRRIFSNKGFVAPKKRAGPFPMLNPGRYFMTTMLAELYPAMGEVGRRLNGLALSRAASLPPAETAI